MKNKIPLALTYDDVLLVPQRSRVEHRGDVDTTTYLTKDLKLKIPFISANMDTVTESEMAIAMARLGGLGIIHRFMTIEEQVSQVDLVTRYESFIIDKPYTISPNKSLRYILDKSQAYQVFSYAVVDENQKLLGLITKRDVLFQTDMSKKVSALMTPIEKLVTAPESITIKKAKEMFAKSKVEKLPVIDKKGILKGLITAKSIENHEQNPQATKDRQGRLRCGAAVGVVGDFLERAKALIDAHVDVIVVDVAHGQNKASLRAIKTIRNKFPDVRIVGGNIATAAGVRDMIRAGVDAVKVGIGPGGICSTRTVTGVGVPQLSAIMECVEAAKGTDIKVIADGGTNYPGDITKALAAGANVSMLAGWFAGTSESPGEIIVRKNRRYKIHRGSASFMSQADAGIRQGQKKQLNTIVPEGVESLMEYKGSVSGIVYQLLGGLRSGMSYSNALTIPELQKRAKFIRITSAGFRESLTHNINEI
jgi:IMP dehydrogenase